MTRGIHSLRIFDRKWWLVKIKKCQAKTSNCNNFKLKKGNETIEHENQIAQAFADKMKFTLNENLDNNFDNNFKVLIEKETQNLLSNLKRQKLTLKK